MPTVKGRVVKAKAEGGKFLALLRLNGKLPRVGEICTLKWGSKRTLPQNSFLWVFYSWLINDAGLKEHGFYSPQALHDNLKAYFLSKKIMTKEQLGNINSEELTTTLMNKSEFSEYFENVSQFVSDFFEIDCSPFFEEHKENYT